MSQKGVKMNQRLNHDAPISREGDKQHFNYKVFAVYHLRESFNGTREFYREGCSEVGVLFDLDLIL